MSAVRTRKSTTKLQPISGLITPTEEAMLTGSSDVKARALIKAVMSPAPRAVGEAGFDMEILMKAGQAILHYADTNGVERYKFASMSSLKAAFSGQPTDSGWLLPGVVRWGETVGGPFVAYAIPPQVHKLLVEFDASVDDEAAEGEGAASKKTKAQVVELHTPLPGLLLIGIATKWFLWAYQEEKLSPNSLLYYPPLPNIFDGGSICWGPNTPPSATPANILKAWNLFLSSPFNDHLAGKRSVSYPNDVRVQMAALAADDVKRFPAKDLAQPISKRSAEKWMDDLVSGRINWGAIW